MLLIALLACNPLPETIFIRGLVTETSAGLVAVPDATVSSHDAEGELVDSATSDADGVFVVEAAAGQTLHVTVEGEGYVRTAFSGSAGLADFDLSAGQVWLRSETDAEAIEAEFQGCEGIGEGSTMEGEVRMWIAGYAVEDGEWPLVTTAYLELETEDGSTHTPCYLDDDGVFDEDGELTGETGRFAFFGLPAGLGILTVGYEIEDEPYEEFSYLFYLPQDGVTPLYPAYVEFPE